MGFTKYFKGNDQTQWGYCVFEATISQGADGKLSGTWSANQTYSDGSGSYSESGVIVNFNKYSTSWTFDFLIDDGTVGGSGTLISPNSYQNYYSITDVFLWDFGAHLDGLKGSNPVLPPVISIDIYTGRVPEDAHDIYVTLKRSGADLSETSTVFLSTQDGAAYAGDDYTAVVNQLITFGPGVKSVKVQLSDIILDDANPESNENFHLILSDPVNASLGFKDGNVTILDNDKIGTDLPETLIGATCNDSLDGGAGNDSLDGGVGNDSLIGGVGDDKLLGGADNDSLLGGEGDDKLVGGSGSDTLDGGDGNDSLHGGTGNDTLTGGIGNDSLDGGTGADSMTGGDGDDTYVVNAIGDIIAIDTSGTDLVRSSVTYSLDTHAELENLTLTGIAAIKATGNSLDNVLTGNAAANTLIGNDGNDTLNGGAGADKLFGGAGDDTYVVDNALDKVYETATASALDTIDLGGIDTVQSNKAYKLGNNLENLTLTGVVAINGIGNALNNTLIGNVAANTLNGGDGADTLIGGLGKDVLTGGFDADIFVFNSALNAKSNLDVITDFASGTDYIQLDHAIFTALSVGSLSASDFYDVTGAHAGATEYIGYNTSTGALFYDADGSAGGSAVKFAAMGTGVTYAVLTDSDFVII